jgi:hypothetical protein
LLIFDGSWNATAVTRVKGGCHPFPCLTSGVLLDRRLMRWISAARGRSFRGPPIHKQDRKRYLLTGIVSCSTGNDRLRPAW